MGKKQSPYSAAWYSAGVVPVVNCVAAYQPKGAADIAASYVNLANPGTNNAAPGTAPAHDVTNGWVFNGGTNSRYLKTGIIPDSMYTIIVRFSNQAPSGTYVCGQYAGGNAGKQTIIMAKYTDNNATFYYGSGYKSTPGIVAGIMCLAGATGYINGLPVVTEISTWNAAKTAYQIYIGCVNNAGSAQSFAVVNVQAFAIYNITLTDPQVATLTAAMAAL